MSKKHYWVYILHCQNNSYYTGYTTDLENRYQTHLKGTGSKYTRSFKPISIAQQWKLYCEKNIAMKIEREIKKLSRLEKEMLIATPQLLLNLYNELKSECDILQT